MQLRLVRVPLMELSAISPMYIGTVAVTPPMTTPAISRATYSSQTVVAKYIIAQLTMNGTARAAMVGFRPQMSALFPAGMDPMIAPIAINEPTHDPWSAVMCILEFFSSSMGNTGDVHASTVPTANGPMVAKKIKPNNNKYRLTNNSTKTGGWWFILRLTHTHVDQFREREKSIVPFFYLRKNLDEWSQFWPYYTVGKKKNYS